MFWPSSHVIGRGVAAADTDAAGVFWEAAGWAKVNAPSAAQHSAVAERVTDWYGMLEPVEGQQ